MSCGWKVHPTSSSLSSCSFCCLIFNSVSYRFLISRSASNSAFAVSEVAETDYGLYFYVAIRIDRGFSCGVKVQWESCSLTALRLGFLKLSIKFFS